MIESARRRSPTHRAMGPFTAATCSKNIGGSVKFLLRTRDTRPKPGRNDAMPQHCAG